MSTLSHSDIASPWLLPDGVRDLLSIDAQKQEKLRYDLTNQLTAQGYELICPPMIEYTESLLGNASEDVKRQTFKIIDQLTGRLMGVRADITPQILRIDAQLNTGKPSNHIARYCYAGHVIHTLPDGLFGSRTPLQLGAEIFGSASIDADIELIDVLYGLMQTVGIADQLHLDVGHVVLFQRLVTLAGLSAMDEQAILKLYANKALPELKSFCQNLADSNAVTDRAMSNDFLALAQYGHDLDTLTAHLSMPAKDDFEIQTAIAELQLMVQYVKTLNQNLGGSVSLDVTGLGYHYHTGLVFNAYVANENQPIVRGGRFQSKGYATHKENQSSYRPATGFSLDVSRLQALIDLPKQDCVVVDFDAIQHLSQTHSEQLQDKIAKLRCEGNRVIKPLTANDGQDNMTHRLVLEGGEWVVVEVAD